MGKKRVPEPKPATGYERQRLLTPPEQADDEWKRRTTVSFEAEDVIPEQTDKRRETVNMKAPIPQALNRVLLDFLADYDGYKAGVLSKHFPLDYYIARAIDQILALFPTDQEHDEAMFRKGFEFAQTTNPPTELKVLGICPKCHGSGLMNSWDEHISRLMAGEVTCPTCKGSGRDYDQQQGE